MSTVAHIEQLLGQVHQFLKLIYPEHATRKNKVCERHLAKLVYYEKNKNQLGPSEQTGLEQLVAGLGALRARQIVNTRLIGVPTVASDLLTTTPESPPTQSPTGKKLPSSTVPHAQFFPPKPEEKYPAPALTPKLTLGALLKQAQGLLDTACPPSDPARAELRRGFVKKLAEYKSVNPNKPPTLTQQQALRSMMQTLSDIQAQLGSSVSQQVTSSDLLRFNTPR